MDGALLRRQPARAHQCNDALDLGLRERDDVFAIINREIAVAVRLVRRKRGPWNGRDDFARDARKHGSPRRAFFLAHGEATRQPARTRVVAHVEGAVFADDSIDRPHSRDVIAPTCGPARDRHDDPSVRMQSLERAVGERRDPAVRRERVVDIGEHEANRAPHRIRHRRERCRATHERAAREATYAATRPCAAASIGSPHLVRRHSTSSAVRAHSFRTK